MERQCIKCGEVFSYGIEQTWWDYGGFDYDTQLVRCSKCDCINILGYYEYPNRDGWYYEYTGGRKLGKKERGKYLPADPKREDGVSSEQVTGGKAGELP